MEDNPTQSPGSSGVQTPDETAAENHYQLDLDEHAPADIDEAFKDAVAAVDRVKEEKPPNEVPDGESPSSFEASDGEARGQSTPAVGHDPDPGRGPEPDREAPARTASQAETDGLRERLMRTLADFDNYRKRTEREKQTLRRFANFDVFKDFLGVLDNLERATESSGSAEDLKQGLRMIIRQHEEILRRHGVEAVEAVGKAFDPTVHEAVAREENTELDVPTVTREMQRGYLLHDRLLRPAMVFVAMPGSASATESDDGADSDGEASD